jgi:transcriptional regulator with XRE-family HTH domain
MKGFKLHINQTPVGRFRKKWGLSQQRIAEHLNLSRSMIAMIEQGKRLLPTKGLLQLAQLEMKLALTGQKPSSKMDPAPEIKIVFNYRRHCEQLAIRESRCRMKAMQLNGKLLAMTNLYQKTSGWMELIVMHIKEAGENSAIVNSWKKHELTTARTLAGCDSLSQMLLRHSISALEQEADLHKTRQEQIRQELENLLDNSQT